MKIIKFPNEILRKKIPTFDFENPPCDPEQLERYLIDVMIANDGIGLAANQVGIEARVFVMGHRFKPENSVAFFNPMVIANTEEMEEIEEGCLSFPGIFAKIKRPKSIKIAFQNSKGEPLEGELTGHECKCFLHELDHLEGITFQDRISPLKWVMAVKKSKRK